ncbi:unnamed protein product [Fusarium venenatum]|uniref:histidine kinase n=1 Tax=Fusarium venenatum TaxID=56646 RepID=A0A2L2SZ29_9HYPO|nr:uncharacterized protein FVRRES_07790 [Fusarium venenatum]CEI63354.1 unnamed protein product [Fusarium venenatum]
MDPKGDSNSSISETKYPRRFRKLVIGLRVFALAVTIAGIVVAAIAAQRSPIAIGILGPVFVTTLSWSLIEFHCSVVRQLPTIRPSFGFVLDCIIALGSLVSIIWLGVYQPWWSLEDAALGSNLGPLAAEILLKVALGLSCVSAQVGVCTTVTVLLSLEKPKLPEDGVFSSAQADFSDQVQDLAGLRVRLILGSTDTPVSTDHRKNLEHICKEWLKLGPLAHDESKKPDLMLWAQDALPPTPEFTTSLALIPNVVICLNVLDTYDGGRECNEVGWRGIFEFMIGPRKLAKTLSLAYSRCVDDYVPLSPPSSHPTIIPRPPVFGRHSTSSILSHTKYNNTSYYITKPVSASASVEGSRAGESPVPTIATQNLSDTGSEARKVLLVEDNHINLKILAAYMKKLNLEYDTAVSGKEAVEMYTQLPKAFICILLDISMTVMNDFEAA